MAVPTAWAYHFEKSAFGGYDVGDFAIGYGFAEWNLASDFEDATIEWREVKAKRREKIWLLVPAKYWSSQRKVAPRINEFVVALLELVDFGSALRMASSIKWSSSKALSSARRKMVPEW